MIEIQKIHKYNIFQVLSFFACVFYLFFTLFGTSIPPWGERVTDPYEKDISNPINQIIYSTIFILAFISLLPNYRKFFSLLNREKYIVIFLLWCGITIFWSQDWLISSKRYFQYLTTSIVFISVLLNWNNIEILTKILNIILSIYLIITFLVILTFPQAIDPAFGTLRGIGDNKNILGQIASLNIIFFFFIIKKYQPGLLRAYFFICLLFSIFLLVGSQSGTAIISMILISVFLISGLVDKFFKVLGLGRKLSIFLWSAISIVGILFVIFMSKEIPQLFFAIGKDPTFTGRSDLWIDLLTIAKDHLYLGVGFQAFWIPTSPVNLFLFQIYTWLPNQAHNGYVDIILEIGVVGLFLFFLLIINIGKKISGDGNLLWIIFIVFAILINLQESTFIRPHHYTNVFFFMSFWVLSYKKYLSSVNDDKEN